MVPLSDPGGPRAIVDVRCERVYSVARGGFCLTAHRGVVTTYQGQLLGPDLQPVRDVKIVGGPSRARLSADATRAASTVFVVRPLLPGHRLLHGDRDRGHRAPARASATWRPFRIVKDGRTYKSIDMNFWGVTFASDDEFYATLATQGQTYLVRGSVAAAR